VAVAVGAGVEPGKALWACRGGRNHSGNFVGLATSDGVPEVDGMKQDPFSLLGRLVGSWVTEATHPAMPGVVVHGSVDIEWLEGKRFLIHRARTDHPAFPDSISIIGNMEHDIGDEAQSAGSESKLSMHYFDSRGVFRVYDSDIDETTWRFYREDTSFPQRVSCTFSPDGNTLTGVSQVRENGAPWSDDLAITYRRRS
jgi:hypothetical protein